MIIKLLKRLLIAIIIVACWTAALILLMYFRFLFPDYEWEPIEISLIFIQSIYIMGLSLFLAGEVLKIQPWFDAEKFLQKRGVLIGCIACLLLAYVLKFLKNEILNEKSKSSINKIFYI